MEEKKGVMKKTEPMPPPERGNGSEKLFLRHWVRGSPPMLGEEPAIN